MNNGIKVTIVDKAIREFGAMIIVSLLIGYGVLSFEHSGQSLMKSNDGESSRIGLATIDDPFLVNSGLSNNQFVLVDARSEMEYRKAHIKGAISIPATTFDQCLAQHLQLFAESRKVVVYCSGDGCNLSDFVARKLLGVGFQDVAVFSGGFKAWYKVKLSVEQ